MAITYGFFNSVNHDRLYNARQMSTLFTGIINDGVFMSIEKQLKVKVGSGMRILVQPGRAWFDCTWTHNDTDYPLDLDESELILDRYDAVILEVDQRETSRQNSIKILKGTPGSAPAYPTLTKSELVNQYPLAYIFVEHGVTAITAANIINTVGSSECPFITGILETAQLDDLFNRWQNQWDTWYSKETIAADAEITDFNTQRTEAFDIWFDNIKGHLDGDAATALARAIEETRAEIGKSYAYQSVTVDVTEDTSRDGYSFRQIVPAAGVTTKTLAMASFRNPDIFSGRCLVSTEEAADSIYLYFSERPAAGTVIDIYWSTAEIDHRAQDQMQAAISENSGRVTTLEQYVPTKLNTEDIVISGRTPTYRVRKNFSWKEGDFIHLNLRINTGDVVLAKNQQTPLCTLPAGFYNTTEAVDLFGYYAFTGKNVALNAWISNEGVVTIASVEDIPANTNIKLFGSYTR